MDDFEGDHTGLSGLAKFGEEQLTSLVNSGQTRLNVKNFQCGHGADQEKLCLSTRGNSNEVDGHR